MPRLRIEIDDQQLDEGQLRKELSCLVLDAGSIKFLIAMARLMRSGDLGFWLSPQLMRKVEAFAAEQHGESSQGISEVDGIMFALWLLQVGSMEPNLQWEVESLPNNGGIYRMLLEGGQDGKGAHNSPS